MTGAARDHALPIDPDRLVDMLRDEQAVAPEVEQALHDVARTLHGLFHHEFLHVKRRLRRAWSSLEGASGAASATSDEQRELAKDLAHTLRRLLQRANFVPVPVSDLVAALKQHGSFGLAIDLDLADFEELLAWRRRIVTRSEVRREWFGLKKRRVEVERYDRFCLFARFKGARHFAEHEETKQKIGIPPDGIVLRLFRDVPCHDVEALFPGVRVRMRAFDRALIGVPAVAGALHFLVFKIGTSLGALVLALLVFLGVRKEEPELRGRALGAVTGLAVLLAFLFRQWMRFLGRKNLLHRQLAEHLHSCTLDTGLGVLLHLLDEAEEEEFAEALLAYAVLVRARGPLAARELDQRVEEWLARRLELEVDFQEEDALGKLERLGLVFRGADGTLTALAPAQAREKLHARWGELLRRP